MMPANPDEKPIPTRLVPVLVAAAVVIVPRTVHAQDATGFGTESPAYAAVRWLWFLSVVAAIGAVTFRFLILGFARDLLPDVRTDAIRRAARIGLASAAFALAAAALRLMAQSVALLGSIGPDTAILITGTTWGSAWLIHIAAATSALAAFAIAARGLPGGWFLAALAIPALAAAPALSGHAAATDTLQPLPILADALHVAAAGGWVGGLLVLLTAGLPATRTAPAPWRQTAILVAAFSPIALTCAAIILVTGIFASLTHLAGITDLVNTAWGRLLSLKILAALTMAGFGAWNFLRLRKRLDREEGEDRLRRSATAELTFGAILLLLTAFLVATEPPAEARAGTPSAATPSTVTQADGPATDSRAVGSSVAEVAAGHD